MYTIKYDVVEEIVIKNSRFITILKKINKKEEVEKIINNIKEMYPKATHYCYGYIINDYKKCSDDKEPSGTAGIPILSVLEKNNLSCIIAVVVRYFGGIKLGAGGLIRAYSKAVRDSIIKSELIELIPGKYIALSVSYDEQKNIDYILANSKIVNKTYNESVIYYALIDNNLLDKLSKYNLEIIEDTLLEKEK